MLKTFLTENIYLQVYKNAYKAKNLCGQQPWHNLHAETDFTSHRLLVGNFSAAEKTLKTLLHSVLPKTLIRKKVQLLMQPMVMIEGGLSEVEQRVLTELAISAGAHKVLLHTGTELNDSSALALLNKS